MTIYDSLTRPVPFQKGTANFWNDPHISEQLLAAHLDPDFEGASRKPEFIDRSVEWIAAVAPPDRHPDLLDVGCGPGLYAERLWDKGYRVTGIDFSRRSIDYARHRAGQTCRAIEYRYGNYLEMDYVDAFDAAILIYCDYGALSAKEGAEVLCRIHRSLRAGGKVFMDVFSLEKLAGFQEKRCWSFHEKGGFWRADPHFSIQADSIYDNHTTLEQTVIVSRDSIQPYYIWNRYFTPESIAADVEKAGFHNLRFFADVSGSPTVPDSETLAVVCEKRKGEPI